MSRYLLDRNIISNIVKPIPSSALIAWMDEQADDHLFISSFTIAEIRRGILEKPAGKKRTELERWFSGAEGPQALFRGRVLPFDEKAARIGRPAVITFTSSKSSTVSIKVLRATSIAIRHRVDRSGILRRILSEPEICFIATASFNSLFVSSRLDSRELRSAARIAVRKARVSSQKDAPSCIGALLRN